MDKNFSMPELQTLEEVAGQYDFLVKEGVYYTKEEKERALFLLQSIEGLVNSLFIKKLDK